MPAFRCVTLVEKMAACMREDFKTYVPRLLPLLLSSLSSFQRPPPAAPGSQLLLGVRTPPLPPSGGLVLVEKFPLMFGAPDFSCLHLPAAASPTRRGR